ncbi:MAG: hypothetical protein M1832_005287 [Thelocarpon impressellum]|nr:MAG: hypothetical protein M1832_005287 [Thelocarpon impressellum]
MAKEAITLGSDEHVRTSPEHVRVVSIWECKQAADCLAQAFAEDEAIRYPIDTKDMAQYSEGYKRRLHEETMEYVTAAHIYNGLVTTVGPDFASVAIWLPPGKDIDGWLTLFRSGLWRMYYRLSKEGRKRFFAEFLPLLHDTKRDVLGRRDADSYYLADTEHRATYLESTGDRNTGMYAARAFAFKKYVYLNYGAAPIALAIMVREPQATQETRDELKDTVTAENASATTTSVAALTAGNGDAMLDVISPAA